MARPRVRIPLPCGRETAFPYCVPVRDVEPQPSVDLGRLAPNLGETCGEYLERYRTQYVQATKRGEPGVTTAQRYAASMDGLLGALFCASDAATRPEGMEPKGRLALVAVGGYARGTLGLHSDIDVLFLCDDPSDARVGALAEALLYPLWDLGVQIGHAVRGVEETIRLAREDIRTSTTLLDLRRVGGDATIVKELARAARQKIFEPHLDAFLDSLVGEAQARHERFGDSLFLLEPEVKLGRGGLRDLDIATWAAKAGFGVRSMEEVVSIGAMVPREQKALDVAREFLWRVRSYLHLRANRQQDRLTFGDQEDIAQELGFVDGITLGVEQFMQAYYRHARTVALMSERMLERARPQKRRKRARALDLGDGTQLFDGHVTIERSERLADDPALALRLYRQVTKHGSPPYPYARDLIATMCGDKSFRHRLLRSEEATQLFLSLVAHAGMAPVRRGSILGELHEVGLVQAMVPEFEPLLGRVTHDVYHVYTVDVQTVLAVDALRALFRGEQATYMALAARLAAETTRATALYVALLTSALGKAHGVAAPSESAEVARSVAERLGLSPVDVEHVAFLVREQATLYRYATQRDIYDEETQAEIAKVVRTPDRLRDLYLVTVSILSTVNPTAMTAWKARTLEDLYFVLARLLESDTRPQSRPAETSADAIRAAAAVGFLGDSRQEELDAFLVQMPDRYLLGHPVDVVRRHARMVVERGHKPLRVAVGPGQTPELTEIVVVTEDRPGLLADVAVVLSAHRLGIVNAEIYTRAREDGLEAFDVFQVTTDAKSRVDAGSLEAKLEADLARRLAGEVTAEDMLKRSNRAPSWATRRAPNVATEVMVDNASSSRFTLVDVFTRDRVGLLYVVASTLFEHGLEIALSKVNTEGQRVADVFYVRDREDGKKLEDEARVRALRTSLEARIEAFHKESEG